ncbi:hypothetical protein Q674_03275 [Acinetobacter sp. COS3]|uniref:CDP-glycerol glycerophosphotransferase family protein n=1 Tax=Acinetobacter sp. COS3 TaxID=1397525 RepID=UPI0003B91A25|nr:CDP-glycerol glycerophosphotransferase family protein [Acinetobacter sp. COS3]ERQ00149.1 hypothetical protein Q674_03275 [Acinetobacter sp. COS3]
MKINKKDPIHWFILFIFSINIVLCIIYKFISKKNNNTIVLYGHKLNGNLKALYDNKNKDVCNFYFLTIDPTYYKELKKQNINVLSGMKLKDIFTVAQSPLIISDHGLHSLIFFLKFTDIKFIDVWHGIPFKGFDKNDFKVQHQYDEVWVTSKLLKEIYVKKFGFSINKVKLIGYTRTDILVHKNINTLEIKKSIGIPVHLLDRKIILFAPTWVQDDKHRNIFPFQQDETIFLQRLNQLCLHTNSICLLRKHLNTPIAQQKYPEFIFDCSYAKFPDAESILLISDILVCDWSSIAFDYLLLDRPTIFLDVPAPFSKGFSLDKNYRFGHIVSSVDDLFLSLEKYLLNPELYIEKYTETSLKIKEALYDDLADGQVVERANIQIQKLLNL